MPSPESPPQVLPNTDCFLPAINPGGLLHIYQAYIPGRRGKRALARLGRKQAERALCQNLAPFAFYDKGGGCLYTNLCGVRLGLVGGWRFRGAQLRHPSNYEPRCRLPLCLSRSQHDPRRRCHSPHLLFGWAASVNRFFFFCFSLSHIFRAARARHISGVPARQMW